jgi:hypothetical protein
MNMEEHINFISAFKVRGSLESVKIRQLFTDFAKKQDMFF